MSFFFGWVVDEWGFCMMGWVVALSIRVVALREWEGVVALLVTAVDCGCRFYCWIP